MKEEKEAGLIRKSEISDIDMLWDLIEEIHKKQEKILLYEDFNTRHTKETLARFIEQGSDTERIWVSCLDKKIIGFIDIEYKAADYLFFDDKYVFIRYFYVEQNEKELSQQLMNVAIEDAKQYGFEYVCGDMLANDTVMEELYEKNNFERYRIRLAKELE